MIICRVFFPFAGIYLLDYLFKCWFLLLLSLLSVFISQTHKRISTLCSTFQALPSWMLFFLLNLFFFSFSLSTRCSFYCSSVYFSRDKSIFICIFAAGGWRLGTFSVQIFVFINFHFLAFDMAFFHFFSEQLLSNNFLLPNHFNRGTNKRHKKITPKKKEIVRANCYATFLFKLMLSLWL